jgi:hypothetical protein
MHISSKVPEVADTLLLATRIFIQIMRCLQPVLVQLTAWQTVNKQTNKKKKLMYTFSEPRNLTAFISE